MNTKRSPGKTNIKRIWWTSLAMLAMLSGLLPYSLLVEPLAAHAVAPAADPAPTVDVAVDNHGSTESVYKAYLPMAFGQGQSGPTPPSAYATALSQALADCAATPLNKICYGQGSVTLAGGASLTTPGQVASLDGVSGLTLVSPDPGHWSVALLRLAVESPSSALGLTLLAFGNVEIRDLMLFDSAAADADLAPALSFSSSPVPGQDPETGGLIVYNPSDEEPLAIGLNGADLILVSSAVVQAQPGDRMIVTMATGSALVNTPEGDETVRGSHESRDRKSVV